MHTVWVDDTYEYIRGWWWATWETEGNCLFRWSWSSWHQILGTTCFTCAILESCLKVRLEKVLVCWSIWLSFCGRGMETKNPFWYSRRWIMLERLAVESLGTQEFRSAFGQSVRGIVWCWTLWIALCGALVISFFVPSVTNKSECLKFKRFISKIKFKGVVFSQMFPNFVTALIELFRAGWKWKRWFFKRTGCLSA